MAKRESVLSAFSFLYIDIPRGKPSSIISFGNPLIKYKFQRYDIIYNDRADLYMILVDNSF
ncbi:MAG: hypothetical protein PHV77_07485 [Candidatus Omnitrophica bacterium]|jgi:hypothetical protein|nr:hypothetical protein [Candidatus Omnitrophota bacterium]